MELNDQIYVNEEELRASSSAKHSGPEKTERVCVFVGTHTAAREECETCSSFKVATLCLGALCFLLLSTVTGLGVLYSTDVHQLSRDLTNQTAERNQLLLLYQNLTDERDQLQASLKKADKTCPDGWRKFGCSCYFLSTTRITWQGSRQQCVNQGADLVIIKSRREMMFLNQLGSSLKFWIGLSQSSSSQWMWTDRSSPEIMYWQHGHPQHSSRRTQNCAAFNSFRPGTSVLRVRSWSDESCGQNLRWVCEKELSF